MRKITIRLVYHALGVRCVPFVNTDSDTHPAMHMVAKRNYAFPSSPEDYAPDPVPTWDEWQHLWTLWDTVTKHMISDEELLDKPIKLRNACIFYLGHIPTFLDMKLTDTTDGVLTEPQYYPRIFARGIDPDVENPEQCHAHSEIPHSWPPVEETLEYQRRVRERVKSLYDSGDSQKPLVGRCLWLGYEHEAMHLETLLYMLVQSEKTLPPPSAPRPNFDVLADQAKAADTPNEWIKVLARDITINMNDPETDAGPPRYFGWDCEKPSREVHVKPFEAKARPITNGEYALYLQSSGKDVPASWSVGQHGSSCETTDKDQTANGHSTIAKRSGPSSEYLANKSVRTVYGPVPLCQALDWPVAASYDELRGCATFMGGRIPTCEEARSIYAQVNILAQPKAHQTLGRTIPAVNSHLVNNGVPESPPASEASASTDVVGPLGTGCAGGQGTPNPSDLFIDVTGCNVGFKQWSPAPVNQNGGRLRGQGDMGGLWEWTSTPLYRHEGFEPMRLYEAYSRARNRPFYRLIMLTRRNRGLHGWETQYRPRRILGHRTKDCRTQVFVCYLLLEPLKPSICNSYDSYDINSYEC